MTQITLTIELEKESNIPTLRKLIKNMKGVVKVTTSKPQSIKKTKKSKREIENWIEDVKWLANNFDSSTLDMNDERTRYIMRESK